MSNVRELYKTAEKLKAEGKHAEAIELYQQVLAEDPSLVLAHHSLAVVYSNIAEYDKAIEHALKACELEPKDPFAYMSLSVIYRKTFQGTQEQRYIQLAEDAMARSAALRGH